MGGEKKTKGIRKSNWAKRKGNVSILKKKRKKGGGGEKARKKGVYRDSSTGERKEKGG